MRVSHAEIVDRLAGMGGTIALLGGIDTGKTTFGLSLAESGRARGMRVAYVDTDLGQPTVGPPTCVGLKFCHDLEHVEPATVGRADVLSFVGSLAPQGHHVSLVAGTARLVNEARRAGCELVVVDTSGYISGVQAELLKYHKLELIRPDIVVGFQRGEELEPILQSVRRFLPTDVISLRVEASVAERSVEHRLAYREEQFRSYFEPPLSTWRVKTTVFMPTLPPDIDLALLDHLVVGVEDGAGMCLGIGMLECEKVEGVLRMVSSVKDPVKGLRLGTTKITTEGRVLGRVSYRELFGAQ
ncbi:MAG: Clp1/GlmU family protein [Actinomycetota bacterium]